MYYRYNWDNNKSFYYHFFPSNVSMKLSYFFFTSFDKSWDCACSLELPPPPLSDHIGVWVAYQTISISTLTTGSPPNPLHNIVGIWMSYQIAINTMVPTIPLFWSCGYLCTWVTIRPPPWPWPTWHSQCTHGSLSPLHEVPSSYHRSTSRSWHAKNKRNITHLWNLQEVIPKETAIKYFYIVLFKFLKDMINILLNFKMSSMSNLRHR